MAIKNLSISNSSEKAERQMPIKITGTEVASLSQCDFEASSGIAPKEKEEKKDKITVQHCDIRDSELAPKYFSLLKHNKEVEDAFLLGLGVGVATTSALFVIFLILYK
jgi:hypothetical protein